MNQQGIKKKILIIDDEEGFANTVKLNLEQTGRYEVRTETKAKQGISAAKEFRPDLILLDVIMPDLDGGEVCSQLQSEPGLKDIPVVFLTAIVKEDEVGKKEGFIGGHPFISKPIGKEDLIRQIEKNMYKPR